MPDKKYCYPDSEVLKNKLNIRDKDKLFEAENSYICALYVQKQKTCRRGLSLQHVFLFC